MDSIVGYFLENWPALTLVSVFFVALIVILVRGMLFLSKFKTDQIQAFAEFKTEQGQAINEIKIEQAKLSTEVGHIHKLLEKLPCEERRKENQASINQLRKENQVSINQLKEEHNKMKIELSGMKNMMEFLKNVIPPLANSQSPLSLNDEGKEHAQGLDAEKIIDKNWEKIYNDLEENVSGKSRYDIQQYIIDNFHVKLENFLEKEDIDNMKEYAFVKGKNVYTFFIIYALIIRDKYFKQKDLL